MAENTGDYPGLMLTRTQRAYLDAIPLERARSIVTVKPYDTRTLRIARRVIEDVRKVLPRVHVRHYGSSALQIAGFPDVDLFIHTARNRDAYKEKLLGALPGVPAKPYKWDWMEGDVRVTLKLVDPTDAKARERTRFFDLLRRHPVLRERYGEAKLAMHGKTYREYYAMKMDFESRVISVFGTQNRKHLRYLKAARAANDNLHMVIPGGRHGTASYETRKLLGNTARFRHVARHIAQHFASVGIDAVAGPQSAGDTLATHVARYLGRLTGEAVAAVGMAKDGKGGFQILDRDARKSIAGRRILVVDDTVKTGRTLSRVAGYLSNACAGTVAGMAVICARNNVPALPSGNIPFYAFLLQDDYLFSYDAGHCALCGKKTPFSKDFVMPP